MPYGKWLAELPWDLNTSSSGTGKLTTPCCRQVVFANEAFWTSSVGFFPPQTLKARSPLVMPSNCVLLHAEIHLPQLHSPHLNAFLPFFLSNFSLTTLRLLWLRQWHSRTNVCHSRRQFLWTTAPRGHAVSLRLMPWENGPCFWGQSNPYLLCSCLFSPS